MEPITLCGLVIVMFGLWVELEPVVRAVVRKIRTGLSRSEWYAKSAVQKPVPVGKLPICLTKAFH